MNSANSSDFFVVDARTDQTVVGLVGAFGARYDVSDHLKLGLSVFYTGSGKSTRTGATSPRRHCR